MTEHNKYLPVPVPLQEARELDGQPVTELTIRPPTAQDVFTATAMTKTDMERDALLFANLTDTTADFIRGLSFFDYKRVEAGYGLFMLPIPAHLERRLSFLPAAPMAEVSESSATFPSPS